MAEEKKTSKNAEKKTEKSKAKSKKSKKNPFKSIASFFKSVKAEGKKVVWAKPKETFKNTVIVLIVCTIAGVAIFLVDTGLSQIFKLIKGWADNEPTTSVSQQVDEAASAALAEETTQATTQAAE